MTAKATRRVTDLIPRRRRGAELEEAICRAAFDELTESGYSAFTIESVAARAQTGKASIYRRWPNKDDLLLDAFCRGTPEPLDCFIAGDLDDSVSTREALLRVVRTMVAGATGRKTAAMHAMAGEATRDPEFARALDRLVLTPRRQGLAELLRRGITLGDVSADAPVDLVAELVPAFFMSRFLFRHVGIADDDIVRIVDDVAMPLLQRGAPRPAGSSETSGEVQLRQA